MMHGSVEVELTEERYWAKKKLGEVQFEWASFVGWKETRDLFLFFQHPSAALSVPKRFFTSDSDIEALRALLTEKLGPPK